MIRLEKLNYFINDADKYLTLAGIILGIIAAVVLVFVNDKLVPAPLAIAIFSFFYLFNRDYNIIEVSKVHLSHTKSEILFITIFILLNLACISFTFRPELYSRPLTYFILISVLSGLLALIIMYLPKNRKYEYLALISIIIIGFNLRLLPQTLFSGILGMDPWAHSAFTHQIMSTGHLMGGFAYSRLPSMHILIAAVSFLTGLNYKWSSIVSVTIPQLVSFVVVYLIGKKVFNAKVGLLGALLLCMSANYISLGFWIFPTGFAMIASAFLFYCIIKEEKRDSPADAFIKILFAVLIVSIHMQVALAIFIFLVSFWIGKQVYTKFRNVESDFIYSNKTKYTFVILFMVLMFGWWIYMANRIELPFTFIQRALVYDPSQIKVVSAYSTFVIPYYQYFLNILPYLFFYGFSIVGFLYSISKKSKSEYFALTLGGIALLATPFLLLESNMSGYLSERWIYTAQLFMSIPVAVGVLTIFKVTKKKTVLKNIAIISLISLFVFISVINPAANIDNPQISKYSTIRYAFTDSEMQSVATLQNINNNTLVYTDRFNARAFSNQKDFVTMDYVDRFISDDKNYTAMKGLVVLRTVLVNGSVPNLRLNYNPISEMSVNTQFSRVYDSGGEVAFLNLINQKRYD